VGLKIRHWIPAYGETVNANIWLQGPRDGHEIVTQRGHDYLLTYTWANDLPRARNSILVKSLEDGIDFLLMQDADVWSSAKHPAWSLVETAIEMEATIAGAMVGMRVLKRANVQPARHGEIYECEKIGTGFICIDVNRVRAWAAEHKAPFFAREYRDDYGSVAAVGEDIHFCGVVRKHGGKIVCNATLPTFHAHLDSDSLHVPGVRQTAERTAAAVAG